MERQQIIRLFLFGYINMLPNIVSMWVLTILPEIMKNNFKVKDVSQIAIKCGLFFSTFFFGIIFGSLLWPYIIFYISKRNALLIGLIGMGFFNSLVGSSTDLYFVFFFRFLTGFFHNLNSVGKDFIFMFARPSNVLFGFSTKTFFSFIGGFIGPFIGFAIYKSYDNSFSKVMNFISILFIIGIVAFIIVFYVFFVLGDAKYDLYELNEEEIENLNPKIVEDFSKQKGFLPIWTLMLKNTYLRNLTIVYCLTNGIYKTCIGLAIIYSESLWLDYGYGLSSLEVSNMSLTAFVPAAIMVFFAPSIITNQHREKKFIEFFIVMLMIAIFLFPLMRDVLGKTQSALSSVTGMLLLIFLFLCLPKIYSPYINYELNNAVSAGCRTALNATTILFSTISAIFFSTIIFPLYSWSIYGSFFEGNTKYSKYIPFLVLDLGLLCAFILLKKL